MKKQKALLRTLQKKNIVPQEIYCQPEIDEKGFTPPKHGFQASKLYLLINESGCEEDGIVICPEHNQPISVNVIGGPRAEEGCKNV